MTALEKITEPRKWGWYATVEMWGQLVYFYQDDFSHFHFADGGDITLVDEEGIEELEITGYLYAGELAGNEPIPIGQKFRVKETGIIVKYHSLIQQWEMLYFGNDGGELNKKNHFRKSEIEPVFD